MKILYTILLAFLLTFGNQGFSQTLKILPLGNSITQAENINKSYRYNLWTKLIDEGIDFDYVGSMTDHYNCGTPSFPTYQGQTFDTDHEGHWGWRCDQILGGRGQVNCWGTGTLSEWLDNYTPDITLIHLGTNDALQLNSASSTIEEIENIIDTLRHDNPNVIILLATLLPVSSTVSFYYKIDEVNDLIWSVPAENEDPNSPIYIVDQNAGFDPDVNTYDGVHPNESGEELMAEKWRQAIVAALNPPPTYHFDLKVILEGPYNGTEMDPNILDVIPTAQPFSGSPWNYNGFESVASVPADVVDWVLVELRDATQASLADNSTIIQQKACFVKTDGQIVSVLGETEVAFSSEIDNGIFAVIYHRNHLSILSSAQLSETGGVYSYDFRDAASKAYGSSLADLGGGSFGMFAGDLNSDGTVNDSDNAGVWSSSTGQKGYIPADANLDSEVNNIDKNELVIPNYGTSTQVPE